MKTGAKDGGGELPAQQRSQTDTETLFPSATITNIAAADSNGGSPVLMARVKKGQTCLYTMSCNQYCLPPLRLLWRFRNFS